MMFRDFMGQIHPVKNSGQWNYASGDVLLQLSFIPWFLLVQSATGMQTAGVRTLSSALSSASAICN